MGFSHSFHSDYIPRISSELQRVTLASFKALLFIYTSGRRRALKPQTPDPERQPGNVSGLQRPLASTERTGNFLPYFSVCVPPRRRHGGSRPEGRAGGGARARARAGRAARAAPGAGGDSRVPVGRAASPFRGPWVPGREGRGQEKEEGRAAEGRRRCVPRLPKGALFLCVRARAPRAWPPRSSRAAAGERGQQGLRGWRRSPAFGRPSASGRTPLSAPRRARAGRGC